MPERTTQKRDFLNRTAIKALKRIETRLEPESERNRTPILYELDHYMRHMQRVTRGNVIQEIVQGLGDSELGLIAVINPGRTESRKRIIQKGWEEFDRQEGVIRINLRNQVELWRSYTEEAFFRRERATFEDTASGREDGKTKTYRQRMESQAYYTLLFAVWDKVTWKEMYSSEQKELYQLPRMDAVAVPRGFTLEHLYLL